MVAIIAPSILGQFKTSIGQVYGAFKEIGFTDVIEVAEGRHGDYQQRSP